MTEECQKKRLAARHGEKLEGMDFLFKLSDEFEPLGEDEKNAFNITITDEMTKEDVLNKALEIVSKIQIYLIFSICGTNVLLKVSENKYMLTIAHQTKTFIMSIPIDVVCRFARLDDWMIEVNDFIATVN